MVKKGMFVGGAVLLLLGLLFGTNLASYTKTFASGARQTVRDSIPVGFELDRARQMIKDLDPEIRSNMHLIAKEEVDVTSLREQVANAETKLAKSKSDIARLNDDLKRGDSTFVYCGKAYTAKQVENDLTNRFSQFKVKEQTIDKLRQILAARERGLSAGREKLKAMQSTKEQLVVDVENMEARLEMVKVAQCTSEFNFDDSRLARTKDLIKDIGARIDVAEKLVNADTSYPGEISLEEPENTNITEQVTQYFDKATENDSVAVKLEN